MGTVALREAVAHRYREDYGVAYAPDEVVITAGGKQALFHAALALFGPGDEVITHVPGWPTLIEQIKLAGATPVIVETRAEEGFALTAAALLGAVTPRTRGIVINSPTNPDRRADRRDRGGGAGRPAPRAGISGSSWISATTG